MAHLITPHGGRLINLYCPNEDIAGYRKDSLNYLSIDLTSRQFFDLELIMNGGFSPLTGFMTREEYEAVLDSSKLPSGLLWPIPVYLDVSRKIGEQVAIGQHLVLRDMEGFMLAMMTVTDIWQPDKMREAQTVFGTTDRSHPGVAQLLGDSGAYYLGGTITGVQPPVHYDNKMLRLSPAETRAMFTKHGWRKIVAFETRKPLHNAHKETTLKVSLENNANIFLHPIVGITHPGDIDHYARVKCYEAIVRTYPENTVALGLLPLAMRMAGPKEALWHAIIRKNYGCSHFIVTGDHADPFAHQTQPPFYAPGSAQDYAVAHQGEAGIIIVPSKKMVYVPAKAQYLAIEECREQDNLAYQELNASELKRRLEYGLDIPAWFSPPEVVAVLRKTYPPRNEQGLTIFLTGLSGSGKSTIAKVLMSRFMQISTRPVTLLDGDIVRKNLSSELGFSRHDRELNITRIGFVASEITKNGGVAICAPIAALSGARRHNRHLISKYGGYIEVYISTPIQTCESRDRKGLYAKARAGIIKGFTGVDDPYEPPENPEVTIDTTDITPDEAAEEILFYLMKKRYLG